MHKNTGFSRRDRTLYLIFILLFIISSCNVKKENKNLEKEKLPRKVIAIANGVEIPLSELLEDIKRGRFGGEQSLILDELINLSLVVAEMKSIEGKTTHSEKTIRELGESFLDKLFNEWSVCSYLDEGEVEKFITTNKERIFRMSIESLPPDLIEDGKSYYCKVQIKKMKRQYIKDLRERASVEIFHNTLSKDLLK